ncbi:MAG: TRAP transporter small permease [Aminivibrio sp.]|jgi:TRAP-type C4-dicarboxylate transport system permease small subunit|nr:TRAP transporter small permease [Synergistaceae bacterium]
MSRENKSLAEKLFAGLDLLLVLGIVATFIEVLLEVAFRYILNKPLVWGGELSQTILVWVTFVGAASVLYRGGHIAIDFLLELVPSGRLRNTLRLTGNLAILAFAAIGIWAGWKVVGRTWSMRTTAMQIPSGILYLAFPLGCLLTIPAVWKDIRDILRGRG